MLAYRNEAETADCIDSLKRSTYPALTIVLVDNASGDGSDERLRARFPDIVHLQTGVNGGYTAGNNRGIEWALARSMDYLLVLNYDTILDPDCISRLVDAAEETGAAVVVPQILYYDEPDTVWYAGGTYSRFRGMSAHRLENQPADQSTERLPITFVCGCCFLARAELFVRLGGFDESYFMYVEDLEFSVRAQSAGYRFLYEPRARVLHRIGRAQPESPWQIVLRDTNRRRMVARHYSTLEAIAFAAWFYPTRAVHLARYVVTGDWARARAILVGALRPIRGDYGRTALSFGAADVTHGTRQKFGSV